jgi:septum formation protein
MSALHLILASRSPRRTALLEQVGVPHEVFAVEIDETPQHLEPPKNYVARLAEQKASAARSEYPPDKIGSHTWFLGSDTAVVLDGTILGKPADTAEARHMLERLSGREHLVMSAVALVSGIPREADACSAHALEVVITRVFFGVLSKDEIDAYLKTDEPWDKAGGYGIQGYAARFVTSLNGSYSGVVGLPLYETCRLIEKVTAQSA